MGFHQEKMGFITNNYVHQENLGFSQQKWALTRIRREIYTNLAFEQRTIGILQGNMGFHERWGY
jgi:hypothetical protein